MNNRIIPMLALMAGAFVWSSCSSVDIFEEEVEVKGEMTFTATGNGVDTRASIGEENSVIWNKGDEISVFGKDKSNTRFELISGAGTTTGSFKGSGSPSTEYFAIYPYNDNSYRVQASGGQDELMVYWNGAEQTIGGNSLSNAPMVAHTADADQYSNSFPLTFQNTCALVKFTTDYRCKSVTFKARGGEAIAAETLWMTFDEDGKSSIYQTGETSSTITLTGKDGEYIQAGTYYIAVLPGTLSSGFDITFTNIYDEKTYTKTGTKSATLTRSKILNLGTINIKSEMIKMAGTGTEEDPYTIHDFDQFEGMRDFVNTSTGGADYYKLVDDIDGEGREFTPIGTMSKPFCGRFYGNGKTISNIKLGQAGFSDIATLSTRTLGKTSLVSALFAVVKAAYIENVTIDKMTIFDNENTDMSSYEGVTTVKSPFVGVSLGIENYNTVLTGITINDNQVVNLKENSNSKVNSIVYGGVIGASCCNLRIYESTNYSSVSGELNCYGVIGGIAGFVVGGQKDDGSLDFDAEAYIEMCRNFGDFNIIVPEGENRSIELGGIVGCVMNQFTTFSDDVRAQIASCVNFGKMNTKSNTPDAMRNFTAGIVGYMWSDGYGSKDPVIINCINNGQISSDRYAGGIVGSCEDNDTNIDCCANTGTIDATYPSSIVGYDKYGTIKRCWNNNTSCSYICNAENEGADTTIEDCNNNGSSIDNCITLMNLRIEPYTTAGITFICNWKKYSEDSSMMDLDF